MTPVHIQPPERSLAAGSVRTRLGACTIRMLVCFVLLFVAKLVLIASATVPTELIGDAPDYVGKAKYLVARGAFKPVSPPIVDAKSGHYSDYRPPGYPLVVAAQILAAGDDVRSLYRSSQAVNAAADLACCALLLWFVHALTTSCALRMLAAATIGVQPWTSAYVTSILPDTVVTTCMVAGVALVSVFAAARSARLSLLWLLPGSALLSTGSLIRPELVVVVPPLLGTAVWLRTRNSGPGAGRRFIAFLALGSLPLLACMAANTAYRWNVAGELEVYGRFVHPTPGLLKWSKTWNGNLQVKEALVWGPFQLTDDQFRELPANAFRDDGQRAALTTIATIARARGYMTPAEDAAFLHAANERIGQHPFVYWIGVPLFNSLHFWINTGSATYLVDHQSRLPGAISKVVTGSFLLLKVVVVALALAGFVAAVRTVRWPPAGLASIHWTTAFLVLGLLFVAMRTAYFAVVLSWLEYRYSIPGWPFLLAAAAAGTVSLAAIAGRARRTAGDGR